MLFQILKKDMLKRKGVNTILFIFITLSAVFLSSSVNNILVVNSSVEYFIDYANVPDVNIIMTTDKGTAEINAWMQEQKEDHEISDYHYQVLRIIPDKAATFKKKSGHSAKLDSKGASLYLGTMPETFNKVFDQDGKSFTMQDGEIALSNMIMERNDLHIGDRLILTLGDIKKEFTISAKTKDAAFGNEMSGMSRFIVSPADYELISEHVRGVGLYDVMAKDPFAFSQRLDNKAFPGVAQSITKEMYKKIYAFDMIMAGMLILIGVCLILIALLVLRFTLVFTMEEQYQEIGILKALGLRNFNIKKLYLIKYLFIVTIGSLLGMFASIPLSDAMIAGVNSNMVMADSSSNFGVSILCALFIVALVVSFCYFCTRRLNKVSAITAIRNGDNGERFTRRRGLALHKRNRMRVTLYLGINDILVHMKRYAVLVITFCISFILITIPLNTLNTMSSDEMVKKFLLNPDSAVYVKQIEKPEEGNYSNINDLNNGMKRIEQELKVQGYDADLRAEAIFFLKVKGEETEQSLSLMTIQILDEDADYIQYSKGSAPKLENEIAFSEYIMDHEGWTIGDTVRMNINGSDRNMLISGTYTDYMQLGKSARLNPVITMDKETLFDYWSIMVNMESDKTQEELAVIMKQKFPDYEWASAQQVIDSNIGGLQDMLKQIMLPMTVMLCGVIMLITLLMEKLFITREKGEIAMMKSIGFRYQVIRSWQIIRMSVVVILSMIISIPLSLLSNQFVLKPIFAIMGADVTIQVDALQAYLLYPGILLIGIIIAAIIAAHSIKHVDIREMNNLE